MALDKKLLKLLNEPLELEKYVEDQRQDLIRNLDLIRERLQRQMDADEAWIRFADKVLKGEFDSVQEYWNKEIEFKDKVKIIKQFCGKKIRTQKKARKKNIADLKRRRQNVLKQFPKDGNAAKTTKKKKGKK